jgi:hypothetical protein
MTAKPGHLPDAIERALESRKPVYINIVTGILGRR